MAIPSTPQASNIGPSPKIWLGPHHGDAVAAATALNVSQIAVRVDAIDNACATVMRAVRSIATCCRCSNGFTDEDAYFECRECDSHIHHGCIHGLLPCKRKNMPRAPRTISEAVARVDALQAEAKQNVEQSCTGAVCGSSDEDRANGLRGKHYYHRKAKREKHDAGERSTASGSNLM